LRGGVLFHLSNIWFWGKNVCALLIKKAVEE
jgi:hypothetical protein